MAVSGRKQSDLKELVSKSSAEDFDNKCDPCLSSDKIIVEAFGFCVTCQEFLCKNCFKFHKKTSALKHHELLDQESMLRGGTSAFRDHTKPVAEIFTERCAKHTNEFIKYFCPMHQTLGCTDCMTISHRTCKIYYIPDSCDGIADSVDYIEIMRKLDEKIKEIDSVVIKAGHKDKALELHYLNFMNEVAEHRIKIDSKLDELQEKIKKEIEKRTSQDKKVCKEVTDACRATSDDSKKLKKRLQDSKATKQNIQLYINIKQAESKLKTNDLQVAKRSLEGLNVRYKFRLDKDLEQIIGKLNSFGEVSFLSNISRKDNYLNCLINIDNINVRTDFDKAFFKCNVIGCAVLGSNRVILIDSSHNQKLKVVDTNKKAVIEEKVMDKPPNGITALPNDQIAVTFPMKKEIWIMSVSNEISLVRRIKLSEKCHYITYCQGHLYALCKDPHCILKVDLQGKVVNKFAKNMEFSSNTKCIKSNKNENMLYYFTCIRNLSCEARGTIVRLNLNGEVSAVHNISTSVEDMVVLDDESVLVCVNSSPDMYLISQNFKECHPIETETCDTYSICYNRKLKQIYTGSYSGNMLKVYDIKL